MSYLDRSGFDFLFPFLYHIYAKLCNYLHSKVLMLNKVVEFFFLNIVTF